MNIIFYGGHYWQKDAWFRKQQFAKRLVDRGHTVFYIEESVSIIRRKKGAHNPIFISKLEKLSENLFIITPSAYFPLPNNYFFRKIYNLKLLFEIKRFLKNLKIKEYIFWFNKLDFSSVIDKIETIKIFDLCDDLPYYQKLFKNEPGFKLQLKYLKNALKFSNVCIVSAVKLKEKYQKYTKSEIIVAPNGHNLNLNQTQKIDIPYDVKNIKKPIIGFIGTLFKFLDKDLLEYIVASRPTYSFVFVGGIASDFPINNFKLYENFHHLGKKKKDEINSYINSFDICLNPFLKHEVNDSVNPVKVFEYLSHNKTVLSTVMYSLKKEKISEYIYFANNRADYLQKLDYLIQNKIFENKVPDEIINSYTWDNIFAKLIKELQTKTNINF